MNRLRAKVIATLAFAEEPVVFVTELACADEGCPDVETVIAALPAGAPQLQTKWPGPVDDLSDQDIEAICAQLQSQLPAQLEAQERPAAACTEGCCDE